jgi:sirohydrochlorin ferrochelatase
MDHDREVIHMLLANVAELSENPQREVLFVVGHGSIEKGFHQRWRAGLTNIATELASQGGFLGAQICMLLPDQVQWRMKQLERQWPGARIIVVPVFLSEGYFTRTVIPTRLQGYTYTYNGKSLLPQAHVSEWIQRRISEKVQLIVTEE